MTCVDAVGFEEWKDQDDDVFAFLVVSYPWG